MKSKTLKNILESILYLILATSAAYYMSAVNEAILDLRVTAEQTGRADGRAHARLEDITARVVFLERGADITIMKLDNEVIPTVNALFNDAYGQDSALFNKILRVCNDCHNWETIDNIRGSFIRYSKSVKSNTGAR